MFEPLRQLAERFTQIQGGLTAVERIGELLDENIDILDVKESDKYSQFELLNKLTSTSKIGEIIFENVSFAYRKDERIISDLNFRISPGEHVAIVGPTGSGKTTLIRLLCRLYEPQEGNIYIDGIDIKEIPISQLRRKIGVVLQDTFLFSGNIADNLRLDESITDERLIKICRELGLNSLLKRFPNGLNTLLRERGGNISSGERQLLSVARVAIRNPNILILDEATAFMDPSTEAALQRDLDKLLDKRTALVIAHRLATIESSDRILVMKKGRLIEEGTHSALRAQGGLYSQLAELQERGLAKF